MFTLGIPKRQYRRTTEVLRYNLTKPIEYKETKQDDGFYLFQFPNIDEFDFSDIVKTLKNSGVTTIGADNQLTERNIMKLTDLIKEQGNPEENEMIDILKRILVNWEDPQYKGGGMAKCERSDHYYIDIEELIEDYEEEATMNMPDTSNIQEKKIKNLISKEIKKIMQQ